MIDVLGLLGEGSLDLHTSIVLTYSIDFVFYDGLLRRRFRHAGAVNQMVFCDFQKYQEQLATLGAARRFGRSYSVTPVYQGAAFHPKLYMVLGRKGGRLLIGSGNTTIGGLLRNAETFGLFEYERGRDSGPHPAFRQCVEFIDRLAQDGAEVIRKQLARARSWSPWLDADPIPDHRTVLFGGPGRAPLLDQINTALRDKPVQSAVVCTASVDRQLAALRELSALTTRGKVRCIIQPEQMQLDGQAVRRLGKAVEWKAFVDPYPREKKKRRDVYSHAKLMVFDCGDREVLVYGSANASKPALLGAGGNSEIVVLFEPWKRGTAVKRLGLGASLETRDIAKDLGERTWGQTDEDDSEAHLVVLTAAVPVPSGISIQTARGKVPEGAILELYDGLGRPAVLRAKVSLASEGLFARFRGVPETIRLARLVAAAGEPLSNVVGLTWPEVANVQSSSGIHARTEAALVAMQDGTLLGTVLFELLDQVPDFEAVRGGGPTSKPQSEVEETGSEKDRSAGSFYTDTVPGEAGPTSWTGDRNDLDLLAALVQPLQTESRGAKRDTDEDNDDDEADDSVLDEEAERREIDSKKGRATGKEGKESPSRTSAEALQRASKRLCRRLDRAATAVETALARRRELASVPPTGLARQVWMAQIAAFLAGRMAPTSDGEDVLCLEPIDFAGYTLRVCRALSGGKDGGLLDLVSREGFAGPDGDSLKRGMSFLWTCLIFAVAEVAEYWKKSPVADVQDEEEETEYAEDIWDAVPELIAARFLLAVRPFCRKPDLESIVRRLPAWGNKQDGWFEEWRRRIDRVANLIGRIEGGTPGRSKEPPAPGDLVFHPIMGVTAFMRHRDGGTCYLLDLSKADPEHPENVTRVFPVDQVRRIPADVEPDGWVWREPYWQAGQETR